MLSQLNIKRCYRTKMDDVKIRLLIPALSNGVQYDRGTGFFSFDALIELSEGIIAYIRNGGIIRIVTSVDLDMKETGIIKNGIEYGRQVATDYIVQKIEDSLVAEEGLQYLQYTSISARNKVVSKEMAIFCKLLKD